MSLYHGKPAHERETFLPAHGRIPDHVNIALNELVHKAKEGLLVLLVSVGVQVLMAMMAEEVRAIAGPKGLPAYFLTYFLAKAFILFSRG